MGRRLAKLIVVIALAASAALLFLGAIILWQSQGLPSTSELHSRLQTRYHPKGRAPWVPLWAISTKLQTSVVVAEDPGFYFHHGFDYQAIWRAVIEDLRAGAYRRGASTITQQVAKNLFLSPEKTLSRKLREAILTWRLERALSKEEILEIYLNIAEWGDGITGVEAASRFYFSKSAADLTWAEAALLAGILPNPQHFDPLRAPQEAKRRRQAVLVKLAENHDMTVAEFREAVAAACCGDPNPEIPR